MSMFQIKFKIKGKLLALVIGVFLAFIAIAIFTNSLIITIILAIFMFFFLRIVKTYAVAKEEAERVLPSKIYRQGKFEDLYSEVPYTVTDDGVEFHTELLDQSCDCQEYKDFHSFYPVGDLRRICRHQVKAYVESGRLKNLNEATRYMVSEAYKKDEGVTFREILVSQLGSNPTLFYWDADNGLAALIYKDGADGNYEEYRYNVEDGFWVNNYEPPYKEYMENCLTGWRAQVKRIQEINAQKRAQLEAGQSEE